MSKKHIKIIAEYKPCLRAFPKQLFSMVMAQAKKQVKRVCSTADQRRELLKNFKCITKDNFRQGAQVGHDITSLVSYLANISDVDMIIPNLCCGYHLVIAESKILLDRLCIKEGMGSDASDYILGILRASVSDALDMMCSGYDTTEQCNKKSPGLVSELKLVLKRTKNTRYDHSALIPILKVIERIDTETSFKN